MQPTAVPQRNKRYTDDFRSFDSVMSKSLPWPLLNESPMGGRKVHLGPWTTPGDRPNEREKKGIFLNRPRNWIWLRKIFFPVTLTSDTRGGIPTEQ